MNVPCNFSRSKEEEQQQTLGFMYTDGMLKCHDFPKGLLVRKSLHCQKGHEKKAVIIYESGEKPVISCTLGF